MPGRCPHLDSILGVTESITRRDFLDGVLLASGVALTASAVSPLAAAQESQTPGTATLAKGITVVRPVTRKKLLQMPTPFAMASITRSRRTSLKPTKSTIVW